MKTAAMDGLWHASRPASAPERPGLVASVRRLWHCLGATRRSLEAELAGSLERVEALRGLDEGALTAALTALRGEVRLGRISASRFASTAVRANRMHALALLAVAAERSLHWRPYPQQLLAALAMYDGRLVEMSAGEGKTLAVALAAILQAWRGRPCHVATANEYLAQRDAELMHPLYARCGLAVATVAQNMQPEQTSAAYRADVVYAAGKQFLADYLRDQIILGGVDDAQRMRLRGMSASASGRQPTMRGLYAVIVDDAETVLFDEATTPVVISAPSDNPMLVDAVRGAHELVGHLQAERDYRLLERQRDIEFTAVGEASLEQLSTLLPPLWRTEGRREDLVRQAIVVRDQLQPQRHYVVQQERLNIIDDYIGRLLARPAWTHGLQQAIEIKEGLQPTPPTRVLARMAVGSFFRRYHQLGGIGVGVHAVRRETWQTLGRLSLRLPTRAAEPQAALHICKPAIWPDQASKRDALVDSLYQLHRRGSPALVSLRRIPDAEAIAKSLAERGVKCQFFSTRQPAGVTEILHGLAQPGQITLSLNNEACGIDLPLPMATDAGTQMSDGNSLKTSSDKASIEVDELSHYPGLRILQYETQEFSRQDQRILHLAGRHGQPGVVRQYLALDDDLLRYYLPACCRGLLVWVAKNAPEWLPRVTLWLFQFAQRRAQNQARRQRQMQPRREALLNQQLAFAGDRDMDVGTQQFGKP